MTLNLKGKVAVVTGGTRGIGRAIAERLLEAGASVAITGRSVESANKAAAELQAGLQDKSQIVIGCAAEAASLDAIRSLFMTVDEKLGGLDILVNNAGVGVFKDLVALQPDEWHRVIDTNLSGVYYCCHEALPRLKQRGGGWIVNIASLAGKNAFAGGAAYNASKFGLCGMSEAIMLDHRYDRIRVTAILPGSVNTSFSSGAADWKIAPEDIAETVAMVLAMPERTLISHVEVRPSRPVKK